MPDYHNSIPISIFRIIYIAKQHIVRLLFAIFKENRSIMRDTQRSGTAADIGVSRRISCGGARDIRSV